MMPPKLLFGKEGEKRPINGWQSSWGKRNGNLCHLSYEADFEASIPGKTKDFFIFFDRILNEVSLLLPVELAKHAVSVGKNEGCDQVYPSSNEASNQLY